MRTIPYFSFISIEKWSLRSNATPDSKDTSCSCWREKESDEMMISSSDSGITSPNNHHFDQQSVSPCSISVNALSRINLSPRSVDDLIS